MSAGAPSQDRSTIWASLRPPVPSPTPPTGPSPLSRFPSTSKHHLLTTRPVSLGPSQPKNRSSLPSSRPRCNSPWHRGTREPASTHARP